MQPRTLPHNWNAACCTLESICNLCLMGSWQVHFRAILITKNCDVSHCVSSLLRKLAMLAPPKKISKFLEELRMPSLLVQPFPAHTYSCTVYETLIWPLARAVVTWVKSRVFCCVRSHYKTPCEVLREVKKSHSDLRFFCAKFQVEFGTVARQLISRDFKPNENGPVGMFCTKALECPHSKLPEHRTWWTGTAHDSMARFQKHFNPSPRNYGTTKTSSCQ